MVYAIVFDMFTFYHLLIAPDAVVEAGRLTPELAAFYFLLISERIPNQKCLKRKALHAFIASLNVLF